MSRTHSPDCSEESSDHLVIDEGQYGKSMRTESEDRNNNVSSASRGNRRKQKTPKHQAPPTKQEQREAGEQGENFACDRCSFCTRSFWDYQMHMQNHEQESDSVEANASAQQYFNAMGLDGSRSHDESDGETPRATKERGSFKGDHSPANSPKHDGSFDEPPKKKKVYNSEVDPAKYRKIPSGPGEYRYACSLCGNVYKWRKSLNKHWKEKHDGQEPPPLDAPVPMQQRPAPSSTSTSSTRTSTEAPPNVVVYNNAETPKAVRPEKAGASKANSEVLEKLREKALTKQSGQSTGRSSTGSDDAASRYGAVNALQMAFFQQLMTMYNGNRADGASTSPVDQMEPLNLSKKESPPAAHHGHEGRSGEGPDTLDLTVRKREPETVLNLSSKRARKDEDDDEDESADQATPLESMKLSDEDPAKDKPNLMCDTCNYVAPWPSQLERHMLSHNNRIYVCGMCQYTNASMNHVNEHFQRNHAGALEKEAKDYRKRPSTEPMDVDPDNPLKCPQCNFVGRWPTELQKHAATHSNSRPFSCLTCSLSYKWRWDLAKHFDRAHPQLFNPYKKRSRESTIKTIEEPSPKRSLEKDTSADATDRDITALQAAAPLFSVFPPSWDVKEMKDILAKSGTAAMTEFLSQLQAFSAPLIKASAAAAAATAVLDDPGNGSEADDSGDKSKKNASRNFPCMWCDFRARWKSELIQHMRCHHAREKPFKCSDCSYSSNWKWDVQKHIRKQHPDSSAHIIEVPDEELFSHLRAAAAGDAALRALAPAAVKPEPAHIENGKPCAQCPFVAKSFAELQRHLLLHTNEKPFECSKCDFTSKWKREVKKHMRMANHHGPILVRKSAYIKSRTIYPKKLKGAKKEHSTPNGDKRGESTALDQSPEDDDQMSNNDGDEQCGSEASGGERDAVYEVDDDDDSATEVDEEEESNQQASDMSSSINSSPANRKLCQKRVCKTCNYTTDDLSQFLQHRKLCEMKRNNQLNHMESNGDGDEESDYQEMDSANDSSELMDSGTEDEQEMNDTEEEQIRAIAI